MSNLQQMNSRIIEVPQQEQSDKKEIHTIDSSTILSDNLNRTLQLHFFTAKTKISKAFYNIHFIKALTKKKENKSVLAKNHYFDTIIPIRFKQTDILFPFHNFW
ncbi:hypothetical protein [Flavobacterium facile]|uniref:hypothetical protein n=1 Tax=Flavobacterium facile TaxID=2893174 RepID=UPI002E75CAB9|nr:hypothetical protein [Flavobacterium sp. T-12]